MTQRSFVNLVIKELRRNKAKSAVLGLMFLVALYFWVPIVARWTSGRDEPAAGTVMTGDVIIAPATDAAATASAPQPKQHRWQDLLEAMRRDPLMQPATLPDLGRNPFQVMPASTRVDLADEPPPAEPEPSAPPPEFSLEQLGLVLESTVIGRVNRVAKINGTRYRLHDWIVVPIAAPPSAADQQPTSTSTVELRLTEIHPDHVVLQHDDNQYRLQLKRPDFRNPQRVMFNRASFFQRSSNVDQPGT